MSVKMSFKFVTAIIFTVIFLFAMAFSQAFAAGAASIDNLVINPGFETVADNGFAANWDMVADASNGTAYGKIGDTLTLSSTEHHTGSNSVRLAFSNASTFVTCGSEKMRLKPNTKYVLSWWVKIQGLNKDGSYAYAFLQLDDKQVYLDSSENRANSDWRQIVFTYTTSDDYQNARLVFTTYDRSTSTTPPKTAYAWFDDAIVFEQGQPPPSFCPLKHGQWQVMPELTDEFNGTALDASKWQIQEYVWGKTYYSKNNIKVADGKFQIELRKETIPNLSTIYTSGVVKSLAKARYGYFEANCKLTKAFATNAFWFLTDNKDGCGWREIDILESMTKERKDIPSTSPNYFPVANRVNTNIFTQSPVDFAIWSSGTKRWPSPYAMDKNFHRYGCEWDGDHVSIYFDGELILSYENTHTFDPMNILFNLVPGWYGWPDDADLPANFEVDSIRAWTRTDIQDNRVWDYNFTLPETNGNYRIATTDGGWFNIYRASNGYIRADYLNDSYFSAQTDPVIKKTFFIRSKEGKNVGFNIVYQANPVESTHNGYNPWRFELEPVNPADVGKVETLTLVADNGKEVKIKITYSKQTQPVLPPTDGLVLNPGFETVGSDGFAANWSMTVGNGTIGSTLILDNTERHSGNYSARLSFLVNGYVTCGSETMTLKPNTKYVISWWEKTQGIVTNDTSYTYAYLLINGTTPYFLPYANLTVNSDWKQFKLTYTTPNSNTGQQVRLVFVTKGVNSPSAYAWFDDVAVFDPTQSVLKSIALTADKTVLKSTDTASLLVTGTLNDDTKADLSKAQVAYASDNEQVAKVDGTGTVTALGEGTANITVKVTLEGVTKEGSIKITVDNTPPSTASEVNGSCNNDWYNSDVSITLYAEDKLSEVKETVYRVGDAEEWLTYQKPFAISQEGTCTVQYYSTDKAGNVEDVKQQTIKIDRTVPAFSLMVNGNALNEGDTFEDCQSLIFKAWDDLSGLASAKVIINGTDYAINPQTQSSVDIDLAGKAGSYTGVVVVEDIAGNIYQKDFTFTVTTSVDSIRNLIDRFIQSGDLGGPLANQLINSLEQAKHQLEKGRPDQASEHMNDFAKHLDNKALAVNISDHAKEVLNADIQVLIKDVG